ncbi:uncharacterized protein LOC143903194 [Temnothorax americanus]|uniref:uncharacterized protein LOC143903194 n=1 Tax=Temnothorax americanus TaxID=1964332 RepID=UPI0040691522
MAMRHSFARNYALQTVYMVSERMQSIDKTTVVLLNVKGLWIRLYLEILSAILSVSLSSDQLTYLDRSRDTVVRAERDRPCDSLLRVARFHIPTLGAFSRYSASLAIVSSRSFSLVSSPLTQWIKRRGNERLLTIARLAEYRLNAPIVLLSLPEKKVLYAWQKVTTDTFDLDFVDRRRAELEVKDCHLKLVRLMGLSVFLRLWLCYASKTLHNPTKRLYRFLSTLYVCLSRSARAVLQFYPENGQGLPFKAGTFDGAVSISALVVVLCKQNFAQSYKTFISFLINVVCMSVKKRKSSVTILSRER